MYSLVFSLNLMVLDKYCAYRIKQQRDVSISSANHSIWIQEDQFIYFIIILDLSSLLYNKIQSAFKEVNPQRYLPQPYYFLP